MPESRATSCSLMMSEKDWDDVLDTNLKGAFNLTKPVVGVMFRQRSGTDIEYHFDQRNCRHGRPGELLVIQSRHDWIHKSARQRNRKSQHHRECSRFGFRRNRYDRRIECGIPSAKPSNRFRSAVSESLRKMAEVALFMLSPNASYMTGQVLQVDGGLAI